MNNATDETRFRPVTAAEFFAAVGNQNVHPHIQPGPYPYTSIWSHPQINNLNVIGKSDGVIERGVYRARFYLLRRGGP